MEVAAKRDAREVRAVIMRNRQKAQRMTKLIDPLDLTAKQLETQLLKESRTKCNRQLCKQVVNDVAYFENYLAGLVNVRNLGFLNAMEEYLCSIENV